MTLLCRWRCGRLFHPGFWSYLVRITFVVFLRCFCFKGFVRSPVYSWIRRNILIFLTKNVFVTHFPLNVSTYQFPFILYFIQITTWIQHKHFNTKIIYFPYYIVLKINPTSPVIFPRIQQLLEAFMCLNYQLHLSI